MRAEPDQDKLRFGRAAFSNVLEGKVGSLLAKAADLQIRGVSLLQATKSGVFLLQASMACSSETPGLGFRV